MQDATCTVCPAQVLGLGEFDVVERPGRDYPYDVGVGYRLGPQGQPVRVHPFRAGVPPAPYASADLPTPMLDDVAAPRDALDLPEDVIDLEAWVIAVLRAAGPRRVERALAACEDAAGDRFPPADVLAAIRRVFSTEVLANA
ncbi:hypothetical protein GCM10010123_22640 [Pilimelia anulata]|uniref:Uncharacterized protein n=2 Tax=Pilimelia anulata TaxID=53371 RepID=A0A8J3B847_9ACTN|nr:hypothetical protein GCM10010123_22640 [Pilimelia anulata]